MQRVIITGGLGVLGQAAAAAFRREGHHVVTMGSKPIFFSGHVGGTDLADPDSAAAGFRQAVAELGGSVDVLVNAAGAFAFEPVDGDPRAWEVMFAANLRTCANACRAAASSFRDGGAIINVGAAAAAHAGAGMGPYAASKAGVARLTESLAAEFAERIRVNAVLPLMLDTPRNRSDMPDAEWSRWTPPDAVADVIVFLASQGARGLNGALLPVTGSARAGDRRNG